MVVFHPPPSLILYASDLNYDDRFARNHIIGRLNLSGCKQKEQCHMKRTCKVGRSKMVDKTCVRAGRVLYEKKKKKNL